MGGKHCDLELFPEYLRHLKKFIHTVEKSPSHRHAWREIIDRIEPSRKSVDCFEPSRKSTDRREKSRPTRDRSRTDHRYSNVEKTDKLKTSFDHIEKSRRSVDIFERPKRNMEQLDCGRKSVDRLDRIWASWKEQKKKNILTSYTRYTWRLVVLWDFSHVFISVSPMRFLSMCPERAEFVETKGRRGEKLIDWRCLSL